MDIVVDIRGMIDDSFNIIPKEVAVVALDKQVTMHWIVQPPYPYGKLGAMTRLLNNSRSMFWHGLEWDDGDITSLEMSDHLRKIVNDSRHIYTWELETAVFLQEITGEKNIICLKNKLFSHEFEKLVKTAPEKCLVHALKHTPDAFECALTYASAMKKWIKRNSLKKR